MAQTDEIMERLNGVHEHLLRAIRDDGAHPELIRAVQKLAGTVAILAARVEGREAS